MGHAVVAPALLPTADSSLLAALARRNDKIGLAAQIVNKLLSAAAAPKGGNDCAFFAASLKRCPDTNPGLSAV